MREHQPEIIDQFNGLFNRGDIEEVPLDHFSDCNNLKSIGNTGFGSRDGIAPSQNVAAPLKNILRIYNYPMATGNTYLILTAGGNIYHQTDLTTVLGPILTIAAMTDFGFAPYNGRAYITPFYTELVSGMNRERGIQSEFLYVYLGDGTAARKAAGAGPPNNAGTFTELDGAAGFTDPGAHIFGVVYEFDSGYLSPPGSLNIFATKAAFSTSYTGIPVSPSAHVVKRHIVASRVVIDFNGDFQGFAQLFFIPGATVNDNVTTVLNNISFFDQDLIDDATHLLDNFTEIGAGVSLHIYRNRLCLTTQYDNISLIRVSQVGEPEAINQINGFCIMPPNGDPITNVSSLRDIMYSFKRNKTAAFVDNGDDPSGWPYTSVDPGIGCGVHGIGTVSDTSGSNVDFLMIGSYQGVTLFNGRYILPELSWKIGGLWNQQLFKTDNRRIQILNDTTNQKLYVILTDRTMLFGDYSNGLDPKKIKWWPWSFDGKVNCLLLTNVNELIIGMDQV